MMWRKGDPFILTVVMQTGTGTMENNINVPQKIKNRATMPRSSTTSAYLSKGSKIISPTIFFFPTNFKRYKHLHIHCSIIYNSQDMEPTKGNNSICDNVDEPGGHRARCNEPDRQM